MKDKTKDKFSSTVYVIIYVIAISILCWTNYRTIHALDKKVESIFNLTRLSAIKQLQETCHNQGGIYWESKNSTSATCIGILPHETRAEFECPEDTSKPVGFVGTIGESEKNMKADWERLTKQLEKCRKWKEAQNVLRKKNYKEYACKTLDTFEDYLACNEK